MRWLSCEDLEHLVSASISHYNRLSGEMQRTISISTFVQVGDEANVGDIDDPWGLSGKTFKAPKGGQEAAELPEPLSTILLDEVLPVTPPELWLLVMGNSDFMKTISKLKKNRDLRIGRWRLSKGRAFHP